MRAHEFIIEGPAQVLSAEVIQAARYIAKWLSEYKPLRSYTVPQMFGSGEKIPFKVTSPELQQMLSQDGIAFNANPLVFKGKPTTAGGYNSLLNRISVAPESLSDIDLTTRIIAHELQHGVDNMRYAGRKAMRPTTTQGLAYLITPEEINARFTETLYDLAKNAANIGKDTAGRTKAIDDALQRHNLGRDLFSPDATGQQQFNRLRSRAVQFIDQAGPLIDPGAPKDPSMFDKLRKMVTTFAAF